MLSVIFFRRALNNHRCFKIILIENDNLPNPFILTEEEIEHQRVKPNAGLTHHARTMLSRTVLSVPQNMH